METRLAPLSDFCITNFLQHVVVAVQLVPVWQKLRECTNSVRQKVWTQSFKTNLYKKQCPNVFANTRENYVFVTILVLRAIITSFVWNCRIHYNV